MIAAVITLNSPVGGQPIVTPTASFDVSNLNPVVGDTIYFTDTSTGGPTTWAWYIDGVLFSQDQNTVYYCSAAGYPTFTLTVTSAFGDDTASQPVNISDAGP